MLNDHINYILHYQTGTGRVISKNLTKWLHPGGGLGLRVFLTILLSGWLCVISFLDKSQSSYSAMSLFLYFSFAMFLQFADKKMIEASYSIKYKFERGIRPVIGTVLKHLKAHGVTEFKLAVVSQTLFLILNIALFYKVWANIFLLGAEGVTKEAVITMTVTVMTALNIFALLMCRRAIDKLDVTNSDIAVRSFKQR